MKFDTLLAGEPPLTLSFDEVVAAGRRIRRRHRLGYAAGALTASVAVAGAAFSLGAEPRDRLTIAPLPVASQAAPAAAGTLTPWQRKVSGAIVSASPGGWTFEMGADRWEDDRALEATADDGAGPGRLHVGFSTGTQQVHPCRDPEYRQDASCEERVLPDGSVLSLRGAVAYQAMEYLMVTLSHPDGSGINAESANFTIDWPPPPVVHDKRDLIHVTRPHPTYTVEQLAEVVLAIERAVRP